MLLNSSFGHQFGNKTDLTFKKFFTRYFVFKWLDVLTLNQDTDEIKFSCLYTHILSISCAINLQRIYLKNTPFSFIDIN